MNSKFEQINWPRLRFTHRNTDVSVVCVVDLNDLRTLMTERVMPALARYKEKAARISGAEADISVTPLNRPCDDMSKNNPQAADAIKNLIRDWGFRVPDITPPASAFLPSRWHFLERRQQNPDNYWTIGDGSRPFVIGPALAGPTPSPDGMYLPVQEEEVTEADIDASVGITIGNLVSGIELIDEDRIYNHELVKLIKSMRERATGLRLV